MVLSLPGIALASNSNTLTNGDVNVAYVSSIDETGSNIGTQQTNPGAILDSSKYDVCFSLNSSVLSITGAWEDLPFSVSGNVVTTNENRNLLLYESDDLYDNYDIAYMSVERQLDETALYFVNVRDENPLYKDVIKLYMQPQNTNSLIMIEIFLTDDFVTDLLDEHSVPYDSGVANRMQGWFVRYYAVCCL